MEKIALSVMAHPDDCEFTCAGTLALLHKNGWEVNIATMTAGDCGSKELDKAAISDIRKKEARKAVEILNGKYFCLEEEDVFILYERATILKTIELVRKVRPKIVFAPSPTDYMIDHEITSRLIQTACFAAGMPNIKTADGKAFDQIPYLYYVDPFEGKDKLGNVIKPSIIVDIGSTIETKKKMLACHESQKKWLKSYHGIDETLFSMKQFSLSRGKLIGRNYGEGFRMHMGHAFSRKNILKSELKDLVHELD